MYENRQVLQPGMDAKSHAASPFCTILKDTETRFLSVIPSDFPRNFVAICEEYSANTTGWLDQSGNTWTNDDLGSAEENEQTNSNGG